MTTLLHLSPDGAHYWTRQHGNWQPLSAPPDAPEPVWLVTDLPEETLADIEIPRIYGANRKALLERQLATRFPDTPYRRTLDIVQGTTLLDRFAPVKHTLFGLPAAKRIEDELDAHHLSIAALCPTTLLLTHLGQHKSLPPNLFIVLPTSAGLRIVFLKNRLPVLTRLAPIIGDPKAQAEEILRTHRYLGNTRVLPFGAPPPALLLLGKPDGFAAPLATARIELAPPPVSWKIPATDDWRPFLFELAFRKQPYGQLAPLERRIPWMTRHLRRMTLTASALILCAGLTAGVISLKESLDSRAEMTRKQAQTQQTQVRLRSIETEIATLGTTPDQVRRALELNEHQILNAPPFARQIKQLAQALGERPPAALSRLEWQVLAPTATACREYLPSDSPDNPAPAEAPSQTGPETETSLPPALKAEIILQLALPGDVSPRFKADALRRTSARLALIPGLTLIYDPAKTMAQDTLRGGGSSNESLDKPTTWCMTLARLDATGPSLSVEAKP